MVFPQRWFLEMRSPRESNRRCRILTQFRPTSQIEKRRWSEVHSPLPSGGMSDVRSLEQNHRSPNRRREKDHEGINGTAPEFLEKRPRIEAEAINNVHRAIS